MRFSIISSIIFPFSFNATAALSATTANVINGTAPYLTFDGGSTKATTVEGLIGIKLSNGKHYISAANTAYPSAIVDTSSPTDAIELPSDSDTFASVMTLVPLPAAGNTAYPTIALNNLVNGSYNYWKDDDGDHTPSATGTLTVKWEDKYGDITNTVKSNPNGTLSACNFPYKLTIEATGGTLSTQYGVPPSSTFASGTHTYYIKPKITAPYSCNAQPNLQYGTGVHAGPTNQWSSTLGFLLQDVNTPSSNFPTTGSNALSFNLTVAGALGNTVTATKLAGGSSNVSLTLTPSGNVVNIKLNGPKNGDSGAALSFTPTTFELYSGITKIYSFEISKWFIAKPGNPVTYSVAQAYCNGLGYNVPKRIDTTNSFAATGTGRGGNYTRAIGGGLFSEWGYTVNTQTLYSSSDWEVYPTNHGYWTSEPYQQLINQQYVTAASDGYVTYYQSIVEDGWVACVSP